MKVFCSILSIVLFTSFSIAETKLSENKQQEQKVNSQAYGLYRDSQTGRFFSNGNTNFSLKPKGSSTYLERIEVSVDNGPFKPYENNLKFDEEGPHKIRFRAVDPVFNWSPIQNFSVIVDKTPPTTRFSWKGPKFENDGQTYINPTSELFVTADDKLSGVSHHLYRRPGDTPVKFKLKKAFKTPGAHEYEFSSTDNVGNLSAWKTLKFVVDSEAPTSEARVEGTFYKKAEKSYINYGSKVVLSSKDNASGIETIEYSINEGPALKYSDAFTVGESVASIKYRAKDRVGNTEDWKTIKLFQDADAPKVKITYSGTYETIAGTIYAKPGFKISAQLFDNQSGISKQFVSKVDSSYQSTDSREFNFDQEGKYRFEYKVTDNVGNSNEINPISLIIDGKAPESKVTSAEKIVERDNVFLSAIPNQLVISSMDKESGVDYIEASYDGKKFFKVLGPIDLATWKSKQNTVYYRAVDKIGNREEVKTMTVKLLTQGPVVDLFVEGDGSTPNVPLSQFADKKKANRVPASKAKSVANKKPVRKKKK